MIAVDKIQEINLCLENLEDYFLIPGTGSSLNVGDFVFFSEANSFLRVTATRYEQGSGPSPSRVFLALEGCSRILDVLPNTFFCVFRPCAAKEKSP